MSNVLGIFEDRGRRHVPSLIPSQTFHTNMAKGDGLLFALLTLLYHHDLAVGAEQASGPAPADGPIETSAVSSRAVT